MADPRFEALLASIRRFVVWFGATGAPGLMRRPGQHVWIEGFLVQSGQSCYGRSPVAAGHPPSSDGPDVVKINVDIVVFFKSAQPLWHLLLDLLLQGGKLLWLH